MPSEEPVQIRRDENWNDKYEVLRELGKGGFATVELMQERSSGRQLAVKRIAQKTFDKNRDTMLQEIDVMRMVDHPNLVGLIDLFESDDDVFLAMEAMLGGELLTRLTRKGQYAEADAAMAVKQVLLALKYLHSRNIAHCDLKLENLVYKDDGEDCLRVIDLGLAHFVGDGVKKDSRICGTPEYVAPEVLLRKGYTAAVDMWSMGVISYILLCGYLPFWGDTAQQVMARVYKAQYEFPAEEWDLISDSAKDFVTKLLNKDITERMTAEQALEHPWITDPKHNTLPDTIIDNLKSFEARRKFRKGINAALSLSRLRLIPLNTSSKSSGSAASDDSPQSSVADESVTEQVVEEEAPVIPERVRRQSLVPTKITARDVDRAMAAINPNPVTISATA